MNAVMLAKGLVRMVAVTAMASAVMVLTPPAQAQSAPDAGVPAWLAQTNPPPQAVGTSSSGSGWRMILVLLVVAAVGGAAVYMRHRKLQTKGSTATPQLQVVASVRLGPKATLVMAAVGDRTMLLGVTETSIRRLGWVDRPAAKTEVDATADSGPFSSLLESVLKQEREAGQPSFDDEEPALPPAPVTPKPPSARTQPADPLLLAAAETRDLFSSSTARRLRQITAGADPEPTSAPTPSIEAQVSGLMSRKARRRS